MHLEPLTLRDCVDSGEIRVVATATLDNDGDYTPPTSRWYDLAEFVDGGDIPLAVPAGSYFVFAEYIARAEGEPDLEHSFYVHYVDGNPASFVVPPAPAATPAPDAIGGLVVYLPSDGFPTERERRRMCLMRWRASRWATPAPRRGKALADSGHGCGRRRVPEPASCSPFADCR